MRWATRYRDERRSLASTLYLTARTNRASAQDILSLTKRLSTCKDDDQVITYLFVSFLASIDPSYATTSSEPQPVEYFQDIAWTKSMHKLIIQQHQNWTCQGLGGAVQLAWTLALISAAQDDIRLQSDELFSETELEKAIMHAVRSNALVWLQNTVLIHKHKDWQLFGYSNMAVDPAFAPQVLEHVERLIEAFIVLAYPLIRRIKNREEDALLAPAHHHHSRLRSRRSHAKLGDDAASSSAGPGSTSSTTGSTAPRHDIEDLFNLIAFIYKDEQNRASRFWGIPLDENDHSCGNLRSFIDWASEARSPRMIKAFFEMLESLSTGTTCADEAHRFLLGNSGQSRASYSAFFRAIELITGVYQTNIASGQNAEVPPDEWIILIPFCRLIRQILHYSYTARAIVYIDSQFKAIPTLFAIIGLPIEITTKGAVLETIAAFAESNGESVTHSIDRKRNLWFELEKARILDIGRINPSSGLPLPSTGIVAELEQIEEPAKQYPSSTALVELLATLASPPSSKDSVTGSEIDLDPNTLALFPESLGSEHRPPGVDPYVSFVIDGIFLKAPSRAFRNQSEKWRVMERCLGFMETCLECLSFNCFLNPGEIPMADVQHTISHPGFDVFLRLLSASPLLETLCHIASSDLNDLENDTAKTPLFKTSVCRTLHIFSLVLQLQSSFIEVVQPFLQQTNVGLSTRKMNMLRSADTLDALFLSQPQVVVRMTTLINCSVEPKIVLYSVKILSYLSKSLHWSSEWHFRDFYNTKMNRLVGVLDTSDETLRIVDGYARQLESVLDLVQDDDESNNSNSNTFSSGVIPGSNTSGNMDIYEQIKIEIMELLLQNTKSNYSAPNVAHLLLGYDVRTRGDQAELKSLTSKGSGRASLHVILQLLDPTSDSGYDFRQQHPVLAEMSYRLLHQLCKHSYTGSCTSRYLRSQENFFYNQVLGLPFPIPPSQHGSKGLLHQSSGKQVRTSCAALTSTLHTEAWLLESIALELHTLITQNNKSKATSIVEALLHNFSSHKFALDSHNIDQSECRMLYAFYSLDFSWQDDLTFQDLHAPILGDLPYHNAFQNDTTGCKIYDINSIISLISSSKRDFQRRGLLNSAQDEEIKREARLILLWFAAENNRLQIEHARLHMLKAWRTLLDVALVQSYDLIEPAIRRRLLLELLDTVLAPLSAPETTAPQADVLSGAGVIIIAQLRYEQDPTRGLQFSVVDVIERLHNLLKQTLRSISQPGSTHIVRGNLYSILLNYFAFTVQLANARFEKSPASSSLQDGNHSTLNAYLERILLTICSDAAGGPEVWQSVAYATLDVLSSLSKDFKAASKVVSVLSKHGELQTVVLSLKETELQLMSVMAAEPQSLNPLYTYESKMSFLIQLSRNRASASKLVESKVIFILAQCEYLNAMGSSSLETIGQDSDFDTFLPSVVEIQHQLMTPALQLIVNLVATVGSETPACVSQALHFISRKHDSLIECIRTTSTRPTITGMQESKLIITLLRLVAQYSNDIDFVSPTGFGGLHAAIKSFTTYFFSNMRWLDELNPSTELESAHAKTDIITSVGVSTMFEEECVNLMDSLHIILMSYFITVTRRQGKIHPVFDASFLPTTLGHHSPTLFHIANFSETMAALLGVRIEQLMEIIYRSNHADEIAIAELDEYLLPAELDQSEAERRALAKANLNKILSSAKSKSIAALHIVEMSLLLFWRHLSFYIASSSSDGTHDSNISIRLNNTTDVQSIKQNAQGYIEKISNLLSPSQMLQEALGPEARSHQALLESLWRNCNDVLSSTE